MVIYELSSLSTFPTTTTKAHGNETELHSCSTTLSVILWMMKFTAVMMPYLWHDHQHFFFCSHAGADAETSAVQSSCWRIYLLTSPVSTNNFSISKHALLIQSVQWHGTYSFHTSLLNPQTVTALLAYTCLGLHFQSLTEPGLWCEELQLLVGARWCVELSTSVPVSKLLLLYSFMWWADIFSAFWGFLFFFVLFSVFAFVCFAFMQECIM